MNVYQCILCIPNKTLISLWGNSVFQGKYCESPRFYHVKSVFYHSH